MHEEARKRMQAEVDAAKQALATQKDAHDRIVKQLKSQLEDAKVSFTLSNVLRGWGGQDRVTHHADACVHMCILSFFCGLMVIVVS